MIYEVRTYRLKPRGVPEFLKAFGEGYESRKELSPISAFLYSEIGPLNQVVHIWPYESAGERERIRAESMKNPDWPPKVAHLQEHMTSEIFVPFPFTPQMATGKLGPIFEWRSYMLRPGAMPGMIDAWAGAIEERTKLSPLVVAMHTDHGDLNKFVHIWGYESLEQRAEVRARAAREGIWPPKRGGDGPDPLITQENKIMLAAPFSPLQ